MGKQELQHPGEGWGWAPALYLIIGGDCAEELPVRTHAFLKRHFATPRAWQSGDLRPNTQTPVLSHIPARASHWPHPSRSRQRIIWSLWSACCSQRQADNADKRVFKYENIPIKLVTFCVGFCLSLFSSNVCEDITVLFMFLWFNTPKCYIESLLVNDCLMHTVY